jgi:hypothetical protein
MGIPALRDYKSSKGMQVSISFVRLKGENTGTIYIAGRPSPVVFSEENSRSTIFRNRRSRTKDERNAVKA